MYFEDGSRERWYYEDGKREGIWKRWNAAGALVNACEYRDGKPWDGMCRIFDQKEFYAEYRKGKPWNGALWWMQDDKDGGCFIDGPTGQPKHLNISLYLISGTWLYFL